MRRLAFGCGVRWMGTKKDFLSLKVKGNWTYLYRAVDKYWRTVDFLLSERRGVTAAKRFFRRAMRHNGRPRVITPERVTGLPPASYFNDKNLHQNPILFV